MDVIKAIIEKIELQSILVLIITLIFGYLLIRLDTKLTSAVGILGCVSMGAGIFYTLISFFFNQIKESYKDVIEQYQRTIATLRSNHDHIEKSYQTLSSQGNEGKIGTTYKTMNNDETLGS